MKKKRMNRHSRRNLQQSSRFAGVVVTIGGISALMIAVIANADSIAKWDK